jgi:hypothetical protein
VLEAVWKSAPDHERELWRGIAQRIGCWAAPAPAGLDITGLQAHADALARRIEHGGLADLSDTDLKPRLRMAEEPPDSPGGS